MLRYSRWRVEALDLLSLWVGAGYLASETVEMMFGNLHHCERLVLAVAAAVAIVATIYLHWRRRSASREPG